MVANPICTIRVYQPDGVTEYTSGPVQANMQIDDGGSGLPEQLQGRGSGGLDMSDCYIVFLDLIDYTVQPVLPTIDAQVNVVTFPNFPHLVGTTWTAYKKPEVSTYLQTITLYVKPLMSGV
jgi:hypothetical protein